MANNSAKKQERIYQRNEEKDRIEIAKLNKADYMRHFPGGGSGYGEYGIKQFNTNGRTGNRSKFIKEI